MFIALAVIDKHRYAILNELHQFDEVLKVSHSCYWKKKKEFIPDYCS